MHDLPWHISARVFSTVVHPVLPCACPERNLCPTISSGKRPLQLDFRKVSHPLSTRHRLAYRNAAGEKGTHREFVPPRHHRTLRRTHGTPLSVHLRVEVRARGYQYY